jgi:hypothetical protein
MTGALDPRAAFEARCWARARLWRDGAIDSAVDELQAWAERIGLEALGGQDEVQRMMSAAFAAVRTDLAKPPAEPPAIEEPDPTGTAASTLAAAEYLVRQKDHQRLRRWLASHSVEERQDILNYLSKGSRHAAA